MGSEGAQIKMNPGEDGGNREQAADRCEGRNQTTRRPDIYVCEKKILLLPTQ